MEAKHVLKDLKPYQQGKQTEEIKKEYQLDRVVKLASNENPFGYSNHVKDTFSSVTHDFHVYPDGYTAELRQALAVKLNINEKNLVFGSGSDEIIQTISRTFLYPGVNAIMATPTFPQYRLNTLIEGADIKEVPTVDGYHDLPGMLDSIDEHTKVVWLCSPDNPTGTIITKSAFYDFMKQCPKDVLVVLDEAYYEYMDKDLMYEAETLIKTYTNLILLRTFSKAYGLAGLRIGYGITTEAVTNKLDIVRGPFNTSTMAQKAALIALKDVTFLDKITSLNRQVKRDFEVFLNDIGWHYYESQTNFLLISTPISGTDVFQFLIENGFIIRPGELLGYPNTIRVTIGNEKDMNTLQRLFVKLQHKLSNEVKK